MSSDEEQLRYLEDATKTVREQAFYMKRAMDGDSLKLALDHATEMLRELRTNLLTPKNYYELYMKIVDELRELEEYFASLQRSGRPMVDLYEQVQSCGNVVPRLYLLCCVGSIYIASKDEPAKDILKDLVEMTKGVQHPMRGLFLRNYLTLIAKNKLPDVGSPYEGEGGTVQDACEFLLQNFIETNRLWTRMQTQGGKDKKKREKERMDLRVLVGANLVRLSQLEGLDVAEYKATVLPKILNEIVECKDTIAQGYLMDCVIQVFPDEFHIASLEAFLKTCTELKEKVNVRAILETMMTRLANHAASAGAGGFANLEVNAFKMFNDCVTTLIEERASMTLPEILKLQTVLTNFALKCYPTRFDYVTHTLGTCCALIEKMDSDQTSSPETTEQIEALLSAPLSTLALRVLEIAPYAKLMTYLPWSNWKQVAANLMRSVVTSRKPLLDSEQVEQLFNAVTPLLRDKEGTSGSDDNTKSISVEFKEEQLLVSRVVHLIKSDDTDALLVMYVSCRTFFTNGGSQRMQYTLVPLVFAALNLARRVLAREKAVAAGESESSPRVSTRKIFQFVLEIITALATSFPELAYNLFLQAVQAADECKFNQIAYQFATEALLIYEGEIVDSKVQPRALTTAVGTLLHCKNFTTDDYETLITRVAQYSYKLLKKPDQCRMVILCSHMFWPKPYGTPVVAAAAGEDGVSETEPTFYSHPERVLECLQKSLKIASATDPNIIVEILDRYIYYYENDNPSIQVRFLSGLIAIINEQLGPDGSQATAAVGAHYRNTLAYIRKRQQSESGAEKFAAVTL